MCWSAVKNCTSVTESEENIIHILVVQLKSISYKIDN